MNIRASAAMLLAVSLAAAAQQPPQAPAPTGQDYRIVRRVDRVRTPLVVQDRDGEYLYDLTPGEIRVFDNGTEQKISNLENAEQPVSVVVLLDTSQRIKPLLGRVRKSAVMFAKIIGLSGEGAVIAFDDEVRLLQDFTPDHDKIIETVEKIEPKGGLSRLSDALYQAVERLLNRPPGRRLVIVAVTEERDEGSETAIGEALRMAQLFEVSVYTVSLSKVQADWSRKQEESQVSRSPHAPGVFASPPLPGQVQTPTTEAQMYGRRANLSNAIVALFKTARNTFRRDVLETYSRGTAALHYAPLSERAFDEALYEIGEDLRNQYLLTYQPTNGAQEGFHEIKIKVSRKGAKVRFRPGYLIGHPDS